MFGPKKDDIWRTNMRNPLFLPFFPSPLPLSSLLVLLFPLSFFTSIFPPRHIPPPPQVRILGNICPWLQSRFIMKKISDIGWFLLSCGRHAHWALVQNMVFTLDGVSFRVAQPINYSNRQLYCCWIFSVWEKLTILNVFF